MPSFNVLIFWELRRRLSPLLRIRRALLLKVGDQFADCRIRLPGDARIVDRGNFMRRPGRAAFAQFDGRRHKLLFDAQVERRTAKAGCRHDGGKAEKRSHIAPHWFQMNDGDSIQKTGFGAAAKHTYLAASEISAFFVRFNQFDDQ